MKPLLLLVILISAANFAGTQDTSTVVRNLERATGEKTAAMQLFLIPDFLNHPAIRELKLAPNKDLAPEILQAPYFATRVEKTFLFVGSKLSGEKSERPSAHESEKDTAWFRLVYKDGSSVTLLLLGLQPAVSAALAEATERRFEKVAGHWMAEMRDTSSVYQRALAGRKLHREKSLRIIDDIPHITFSAVKTDP